MNRRTVAVVSAGLSQPSSTRLLADQLAAATRDELGAQGITADIHVIELRDHAHEVVNRLLTGFPAAGLKAAIDTVCAADGLIAVSPIFNAAYSGLFKSFFDVLDSESLVDTPVLIAATGGTARHSLALDHSLRPLFAYLRSIVLPTSVFAASEDWAGADAEGFLRDRIRRAAAELADQVRRRERAPAEDPFALTASFDELLAGTDPPPSHPLT